jgi:hypothetical protein
MYASSRPVCVCGSKLKSIEKQGCGHGPHKVSSVQVQGHSSTAKRLMTATEGSNPQWPHERQHTSVQGVHTQAGAASCMHACWLPFPSEHSSPLHAPPTPPRIAAWQQLQNVNAGTRLSCKHHSMHAFGAITTSKSQAADLGCLMGPCV